MTTEAPCIFGIVGFRRMCMWHLQPCDERAARRYQRNIRYRISESRTEAEPRSSSRNFQVMDRTTSDEGNVVSSPRIIYHHFVRLGFRRALLRAGFGMEPVATSDSGLERWMGYNFVMNHQKKRVNHGDSQLKKQD